MHKYLCDFGVCFYDPVWGRWTTRDPMEEKYYGLSSYAYCLNNPMLFVDPDGKSPYYDYDGNFLGVDAGVVLVTTLENFLEILRTQTVNIDAIFLQEANLATEAYSNIYTHILEQEGFDIKMLYGAAISVIKGDEMYNVPSKKVGFWGTLFGGEEFFKITVSCGPL